MPARAWPKLSEQCRNMPIQTNRPAQGNKLLRLKPFSNGINLTPADDISKSDSVEHERK